jgi:purine-binding chemotaxis protein CheW
MSQALATTEDPGTRELATHPGENLEDFVTFYVADQMFGIPVLKVQDILTPNNIAAIPLANAEVKGSINLRGRIVTVIDVRVCLGMGPREEGEGNSMGVTVEHGHDLYTLMVDRIGDVAGLPTKLYEKNPGTLDPKWRDFACGVYRLEKEIMVVLDVDRLLNIPE